MKMLSRDENSLNLPSAQAVKSAVMMTLICAAALALPLAIGFASANLSASNSLQGIILAGILFPALLLALLNTRMLIPYTLLIWAIAPELRRIADWYEGVYPPYPCSVWPRC